MARTLHQRYPIAFSILGLSIGSLIMGWSSINQAQAHLRRPLPSAESSSPSTSLVQTQLIQTQLAQTQLAQAVTYSYEQAMTIGYAATEARDYQTALINFRRALARRPGDIYARTAIRNVEVYILEDRLQQARAQSDWICAATTVDELITKTQANSLERARLVTYRGELTSLIENHVNIENWSSVCPG